MNDFQINRRKIGSGEPVYIIAEISANHNQDFDNAVRLIHFAGESGADAIKLQTYTPDTITLDCDNEYFRIGGDTLWSGRTLYDLYGEAYTPWEWQPKLKTIANDMGMDLFSSPFDFTSVDFLEQMDVPAYKIASFELVDIPLIRRVAQTRKPLIMSTGMATLGEIDDAVRSAQEAGAKQIALLKCNSSYPAPAEEMNLRTIPHMAATFGVPVGLSDHTLGIAVPIAAVALGACIIEKHLTLSRATPGPDSAFSLEPHEFKAMVAAVRMTEKASGHIHYGVTPHDANSKSFRRSLFVVENVEKGAEFTEDNVHSIRPANGLAPKHIVNIIGKRAKYGINKGTPLEWNMVQ